MLRFFAKKITCVLSQKILIKYVFLLICSPLFLVSSLSADELRLLGGDMVQIKVFGQEDLSQLCRVTFQGKIKVLGAGTFEIRGKSDEQLEKEIIEGFKKNSALTKPQIIFNVTEAIPRKIYVQGSFNSVQAVAFQYGQSISLSQVIAEVGGFKDGADICNIIVHRFENPYDMTSVKKITVDYLKYLRSENPIPFVMQAGDVLYVDELPDISISGAVKSPGAFKLKPGDDMTCENLVNRFGGFTEDSQRAYFTLTRKGKSHLIPFSEPDAKSVGVTDDLLRTIMPGDRIFIHRVDQVFVDGFVQRPGAYRVPIEEPMSLRKILVLAGGAKVEAKLNKVRIMRRRLSEIKMFEVDVSRMDDKEEAFIVQPGDYIYVPRSFL